MVSASNTGFLGLIPGPGRSAGEGISYHSGIWGFPSGSADKESACHAGDLGTIPGLRSFPGEGKRLPTPVF